MLYRSVAFLFPGQGAQAVGMGKDFAANFACVRRTFEEVDDTLGRNLSHLIFEGPAELLTATVNSQIALYTVSIALMRVLEEIAPQLQPSYVAGLSLGEYTALTAGGYLPFSDGIKLVQARGQYMNDACTTHPGGMAVVLGLETSIVNDIVRDLKLPRDLWVANYNCPGQVVLSGTAVGIEAGTKAAIAHGAKGVIPLNVHGAFHSGLMTDAAARLAPVLRQAGWNAGDVPLALNVTGKLTTDVETIVSSLEKQITAPVYWEKSIHTLVDDGADFLIEIGSGSTLTSLNKRIGVKVPTYSFSKMADLTRINTIYAS
jgi:[acyl-carrier-protein] S-malonyltransferase